MRRLQTRLAESLRAFRGVFANPALRWLQLAWAASNIGAWGGGIALAVYAYNEDGAVAVGLLGLARTVVAGVAAPFAGTLGDRYARVRVMVASDLVRVLFILAMALLVLIDSPSLPVYVLAILGSVAATAFRPAQAALIPSLARSPEELTASNVTASTIEGVGIFAGPALGGLLLALTNVETVFAVTAVVFAISALLVARVRDESVPEQTEERPAFFRETLAGFDTLRRDRRVALLTGLFAAQTFVDGALGVVLVVLALETMDVGASGLGLFNSASGIGGLLGAVAAAALLTRGRLATDFGFGMLVWGAPLLLIAIWPSAALALVALALVGVGNTIVDVAGDTLLQRAVPDDVLARVFGIMESILMLTVGLGSIAAPLLIATVGVRGALVATGALLPALALLSWRSLRAIDDAAAAPVRQLELLRRQPIFAPLPPPTLEFLASRLVERRLAAGETIFCQGDAGDDFYVIGDGRVTVGVDGARRELGEGDSFGEIALLRDVPRTATVTAATDVVLYGLDREQFIGAVTGHPESREAADAVVTARLGTLRPAFGLGAG